MKEAITHLVTWYQDTLASGGYPLIIALMAIESTFVPIPSEFIIPFAAQRAFAAQQANTPGALSMVGIVIAGTLGSWLGSSTMYWISRLAGKPLVVRYGAYFLMPEAKVHAAENWAGRNGPVGVFIARLLPVLRQLIGIPMGIVKMDFKLYSLFTVLGAGIWCSVLVRVGIAAGNDPKLLKGDMHRVTFWLLGAVVIMGLLHYFVVRHLMAKPAKEL